MTERTEPWRRFEVKVDPAGELVPAERARRAKLNYRAFMRAIARKSLNASAATKARRDAAVRRRLARPPTETSLAEFRREREGTITAQIIGAASRRDVVGINSLRRSQLEVRADCIHCRPAHSRTLIVPLADGRSRIRSGHSVETPTSARLWSTRRYLEQALSAHLTRPDRSTGRLCGPFSPRLPASSRRQQGHQVEAEDPVRLAHVGVGLICSGFADVGSHGQNGQNFVPSGPADEFWPFCPDAAPRVNAIFSKLGLEPTGDDNRRVLAVLSFLGETKAEPAAD